MIAMALVGVALGGVLFAVLLHLAPPRLSPLVQLGRLDAQYQAAGSGREGISGRNQGGLGAGGTGAAVQGRLGRLVAAEFARRGFSHTTLRQDLALTGRDLEDVMGRKVISAVAGLLLALLVMVGLQVTSGLQLPPGAPIAAALVAAAGFFFLPDLEARGQAAGRRRDFRRAFGAYLDLVALEMAGAAAPAQALTSAARVGAGWPMALLRDTLFRATGSRVPSGTRSHPRTPCTASRGASRRGPPALTVPSRAAAVRSDGRRDAVPDRTRRASAPQSPPAWKEILATRPPRDPSTAQETPRAARNSPPSSRSHAAKRPAPPPAA